MPAVDKIDSNVTGLRFAEESSIGVLPGSPVWYPLEPNSYDDFGGEYARVERDPINSGRQRKKGTITDLDASGGFNHDLVQENLQRLLQGFFFADFRAKTELGGSGEFSAVANTGSVYTISAGGTAALAGDLVFASGFTNEGNNGLKSVASSTATTVVVNETLVDEGSPPSAAKLVEVGFEFASADAEIDASGDLPQLTTTTKDLTELDLVPGEFIYIGGDTAASSFATAANNGWARVKSVAANAIVLDKTSGTMVTDAGTGKDIQIFYGRVLKNEKETTDQVRRTYNLERTLGAPDDASPSQIQAEYLEGAVPSELSMSFNQAEKVSLDMSFMATTYDTVTGATGVKSGTRPTLVAEDMFNTTSDFSRIKMALLSSTDSNPTALFAYLTEFSVSINNNIDPSKAISVLGAFDMTAGNFTVDGSANAYFSSVEAVAAVKDNSDVTFDFALVKGPAGAKHGMSLDMPLISLGDGRLNVEKDAPITLPLDTPAVEDEVFGHTLLMSFYDYLPNVADT